MKIQLRIVFSTFMCFGHQVMMAQQNVQDTISTTTNMVASSFPIKNIVVTNKGNLRIISFTDVVIEGPFEVKLGGTLNIDMKKLKNIEFTYDNSGNRTARKIKE